MVVEQQQATETNSSGKWKWQLEINLFKKITLTLELNTFQNVANLAMFVL